MRIVILGASGMLGFQILKTCMDRGLEVFGIVRNRTGLDKYLNNSLQNLIYEIDDIRNTRELEKIISKTKPDYIINCVGIVVQLPLSKDHYESISINSLLPHQLQKLATQHNFRLIDISTDCVFNGEKGFYSENDIPNAEDLYGRTKMLGEVDYGSAITIRTSLIGREISDQGHGLLEWFLSSAVEIRGFTQAIFSGLTTLEFARVILDFVIPRELSAGIYHVSGEQISKYDLLKMISKVYDKQIEISPTASPSINRSLDATLFNKRTGYTAPLWEEMLTDYKNNSFK